MAITKSAIYQQARRARPGIQASEAKQKMINRILAGRVPWARTLEKYGISEAQVNKLRADAGLSSIDFSLRPTRCRAGPGTCTQVSETAVVPKVSPPPEDLPRPSAGILGAPASPEPPAPASPGPPAASLTLAEVLNKIDGIRGFVQINANGLPAKAKDGRPKTLAATTVKQYKDGMRIIAETTGCDSAADFMACLRDTANVTAKLRGRYPKDVSYKKSLGVIVSAAKYIPEFKAALGDEAHEVYRRILIGAIQSAQDEAIERTETATAIPIADIKKKLKDIDRKYGKTSKRALEARLQVELVGIRDDLGGVAVVKSERDAIRNKIDNYYVPRTRKLVIKKFKTSREHPAYEFVVSVTTGKLLAESLRKEPRDMLFPGRVGRRVAAAFAEVGLPGVGVNPIRHSHITKLLRGNPSEANIKRVAGRFKHSQAMTTRYYRQGSPGEGVD